MSQVFSTLNISSESIKKFQFTFLLNILFIVLLGSTAHAQPVTAIADSGVGFETDQDTPFVTGNVLTNDTGSFTPFNATSFDDSGTVGTVSFNTDVDGTATFNYDPDGNFDNLALGDSDTDVFDYTVQDTALNTDSTQVVIVINGVNDDPVAADDSGTGFSTGQNTPFTTADVTANDDDVDDGAVLIITAFDATSTGGGTVTDNGNGTFDYDPIPAAFGLADGTSTTDTFTYTLEDEFGASDTATVTITVTQPAKPSGLDLDAGSDSGSSDTDDITNDNTPTINGISDPGAFIDLESDIVGGSVGTTTADGSGNWSITTSALADNTHSLTATAELPSGTVSGDSVALSVTIDTMAPSVPSTPDLDAGSDLGTSNTDNITSDDTPEFTGTSDANETVSITSSIDGAVGSATADGAGNWSVTTSALSEGVHNITATSTDTAGNTSSASAALSVTIDTTINAPSTPDLNAGSDSGSSNTDDITNDNTPTFDGTGDAGDTVTVISSVDGTLGTTTVTGGGTWSFTSAALTEGGHNITAQSSDTAGNTSASSAALAITIDTMAPSTPSTPDLNAADDSGTSNTDNLTNVADAQFDGTGDANVTINLISSVDGAKGSTTSDGSGNWSITATPDLTENTHNMTATATDTAGNTSAASAALSVTIDVTAPAVPSTPDLDAGSDTGDSSTDNITSDDTPSFSGTSDPNVFVTIFSDVDASVASVTATAGGTWTVSTIALSEGDHAITALAADAAGNASAQSAALDPVTIDTMINDPSVPDLDAGSDNGSSNTDDVTNDNTPTFTGTADPGDDVTIFSDVVGGAIGTAVADGSGNWSITSIALADGDHDITAQSDDVAGNTSAVTSALTVTIDTSAPAAPSTPDLEASSDNGAFNNDNVTNDDTPDFSGTAEANSTVSITSSLDGAVGSSAADGAGNWTVTTSMLSEGSHFISATATDLAGNTGASSGALLVVIDVTPPATPSNVDLDASTDTGDFNNDDITSDTTVLISGDTDANTDVTLSSSLDGVIGSDTSDASGDFDITTIALSEGSHDITAVATDLAGNDSSTSVILTVVVDTTAPSVPSTPDLDAGSDLGSSSTDDITSDNTPTISGTGDVGSLVRLVSDVNGNIGSVLVDGSGNWSITSSTLNDGAHNITATASDSAGNTSAATAALVITIDTAAPAAPSTPDLDSLSDTGASNTDDDTSDNTPTLNGTGTAGTTVTVTSSVSGAVGSTTVGGGGTWSVTTSTLPDGSHTFTATATDTAGNVSASSAGLAVNIDTTINAPAGLDLDAGSDSGASSTDDITNDNTPTITGTADANVTVDLTSSIDGAVGSTTSDGSGNWSITASSLSDGTHSLTATGTDTAGNVSAASSALSVEVDTDTPLAPGTPDLNAASDSGTSNSDDITNDNTPTVDGTGEVGATIALSSSVEGSIGSATVDGSGNWSIDATTLSDALHTLTATATDVAGNTSVASSGLAILVDTSAPVTPSTPDLDVGSDTGASNTDDNTSDNTPTLTGTAEAGSTVALTSDVGGSVGSATADLGGSWSITASTLADGVHSLTVTSTDVAGNTSSASSALSVTIDTAINTPAALDLVSSSDTGDSDNDDITRDNTPTITGTADAGDTVTLTSSVDGVVGTATTNGSGVWTITTSTLTENTHSLTAVATDTAGNTSSTSSALSVTVDRTVAAPSAPDLDAGSDSGSSSTDDITNDNTPTFTGTAEANSTVKLTSSINGMVGSAAADGSGNWTITSSALVDGTHVFTASTTDVAGNASLSSTALSVVIDTVAPATPAAPDLDAASDSGSSDSDDITNDNTPTLSGTAEAGSTVAMTSSVDGAVGSATTDGSGNWSLTTSALSDATHSLTVTATDTAGNTSASSSALSVEIDTAAPAAPSTPDLDAGSDTGASSTDDNTSDNTPTLTGTAEANSTVALTSSIDGAVGSTTADGSGNWSITASTLADGTHSLTATSTDTAGNTSVASSALSVVIDTAAPAAPAGLDLDTASDSGSSNTDDITNDNTPTINGTAEANSTVELTSSIDGSVGTTTADGSGNWSITASTLADGVHSLTATSTDTAGNTSAASTALSVTIDTAAPAAPSTPDLNAASDAGSSNTDNITNDTTPQLDGTAEAGATIAITSSIDGAVGTGTADGSGNWSISTSALSDGVHTLTATATDTAGNVSPASAGLAVTINTSPPVAPAGLDLESTSDTGSSDTDDITSDNTPDISGTTEANATVALTSDVDGALGSVQADGSGNWTITSSVLSEGIHMLTAVATDLAGNVGPASTALQVTIVGANQCFFWNSNLGMQNVVALRNTSDSTASTFDAVLRNGSGTELGRLSGLTVPAGGERDVLLETIPGFAADSFGMLDIVENGTNNLDGHGCKYAFNDDGTSQIELCTPLPEVRTGNTFLSWNTANPTQNPSKVANSVPNFLSIANHLNSTQTYTVEVYDSAGSQISGAIASVSAHGRVDLGISGGAGQLFGSIRIVPTNASAPYKAEVTRYAIAGSTVDFAIALEARPGSSMDHFVPVSTTASGDDFLVVSSADPTNTSAVTVNFIAEDGTTFGPATFNLAPFTQRHVFVDSFLPDGTAGVAQVISTNPVIVDNTVYFRNATTGDVTGAYGDEGRTMFGDSVFESQNSFLSHGMFVRVFNTTGGSLDVDLSLNSQAGAALGMTTRTLPAGTGRTISVNSLPFFNGPNTVGRLQVDVVGGGGGNQVLVDVLRVRLDSSGNVDGIEQLPARQ